MKEHGTGTVVCVYMLDGGTHPVARLIAQFTSTKRPFSSFSLLLAL